MKLAAGIDFGGTSAKIGLVDPAGTIVAKDSVALDPGDSFDGLVQTVAASLQGLLSRAPAGTRLSTIGIGTPGFIDKREGLLIGGCENIPSLQRRSVQQAMAKAFSVPAFAENDATAAAAGELAFGAGRRYGNFVLITVGTAIGGGLVLGTGLWESIGGYIEDGAVKAELKHFSEYGDSGKDRISPGIEP